MVVKITLRHAMGDASCTSIALVRSEETTGNGWDKNNSYGVRGMLIPTYKRFHNRSTIIRKAHRQRRRVLHVELIKYLRGYTSPLDPLPCRIPRMPTYQEMQEYW